MHRSGHGARQPGYQTSLLEQSMQNGGETNTSCALQQDLQGKMPKKNIKSYGQTWNTRRCAEIAYRRQNKNLTMHSDGVTTGGCIINTEILLRLQQ